MDRAFLSKLRVLGMIEGVSTLLLFFVAMPLKYRFGIPEAVRIVGSLHGFLFVLLVFMNMLAMDRVPISTRLALAGVVGAIFPGGPFVVDRFLARLAEEAGDEAEAPEPNQEA